MMDYSPRDLPVFGMPSTAKEEVVKEEAPHGNSPVIEIDPTKFERVRGYEGSNWTVIDGLGPRGAAIAVLPHRNVPTLRTSEAIRKQAPVAEYVVNGKGAGEAEVVVEALPTHPFTPKHEVMAAVSISDGPPVLVHFDRGGNSENAEQWQINVLRHAMLGTTTLKVPDGRFTLKLWAADRALVAQQISLNYSGERKSHPAH